MAVGPVMTGPRARSARYMARFRCRGGECEDTCCQGWTVPLDEPTHRRLTLLASDQPAAAEVLHAGIELTPEGPHFGRLRLTESGRCGMLDAHGLCRVHSQLGASALFDVCATYPRYYNEVDAELELFGTLSCPEVARLCLFGEAPFELEALQLDAAPRKLRNRFNTAAPYHQPYRLLRSRLLALLARADYPLAEKLFALLWLAHRLSDLVRARAQQLPLAELEAALTAMLGDGVLASLSQNFRSLELDGSLALSVVTAALGDDPAAASSPSWSEHQRLRARISAPARQRAEASLTRYCQNHLLTTPHMLSESLFAYARELVWRAALLHVLLQRQLADFSGDAAELDARIVRVVYRFARRAEHGDLFARLSRTLEQQGLSSFAHTVTFLKL